jgi:hypothetical protein
MIAGLSFIALLSIAFAFIRRTTAKLI